MKLTAVILTKNEQENIEACIKNVSFVDEIVIIDDASTDKTVEIAKKLGARVFKRELRDNFAAQRNFGLEKARGEWVFFVDADEKISSSLRDEIKSEIRSTKSEIFGYRIKRLDVLWGKELKHGEVGNVRLIRLARKGSGLWNRRVHEYWDIQGGISQLKNPLLHYPHQTLSNFLHDINLYSTLHSRQKLEEGEKSSVVKIIIWPIFKFVKNWIFLGGFLDGTQGLLVASMMSFHSFLAWSKLWLLLQRDYR